MGQEEKFVSDAEAIKWLKDQLIEEKARLSEETDPKKEKAIHNNIRVLRAQITKAERQLNN